MNYGYSELITLMALQEAKLLRPKDKKFDWNKIKKVIFSFYISFLVIQVDQRADQNPGS
jgi:hypothetical protein